MNLPLSDIAAPTVSPSPLAADQALLGQRFAPQQLLLLYSAEEWEGFVQEWAHYCLKATYGQVQRFTGSGDRGIDVAGFTDAEKLNGVWDNFQCKHYGRALYPSDAWKEIGKLLWYTFRGEFAVPRRYHFVAPKGCGTSLGALLANAPKLRAGLIENWDKHCKCGITDTQKVSLENDFLAYVEVFDFTIFDTKTPLQLIEDFRNCPLYAQRFGGGLPARSDPSPPPDDIDERTESRYVVQLLCAYADHAKSPITGVADLGSHSKLGKHFKRQREAFYHAEGLRVFARDSVPPGTFEAFQEDVFTGVADVHDADHSDGFARVVAVTRAAREVQITANALIARAKPLDRDGICHQLANDDRLQWL